MKTYFQRVTQQTATRFWINNVTREQAKVAIEAGAVGCTQNPAYTWKMIDSPEERDYTIQLMDGILNLIISQGRCINLVKLSS